MVCSVCGLPDDGYHFKALSCRACAAFYRRSIIKGSKYTCKFGNDCQLAKELRKTCPSCRLAKCVEVGMDKNDVQWHRDSNGPLKTPRNTTDSSRSHKAPKLIDQTDFQPIFDKSCSSSSGCSVGSAPTTSSCSSPFEQPQHFHIPYPTTKTPLLNQLQSHIQQYFKGERHLHTMLHPEKESGDVIVFELATHTQLVEMDKGCLSLIQQMIFQITPAMEAIDSNLKIMLLRSFFRLFSPLRKCYLTSLIFPEYGDQRFAFHYGLYGNNSPIFFRDNQNPKLSQELCSGIWYKVMPTVQKVRLLQMREVELAALMGIILANEIDFIFNNDSMALFRDQIYRELHDDISYNYPPFEIANRFGTLICLVQDLQNISREIDESVQACKLFSPHAMEIELWD